MSIRHVMLVITNSCNIMCDYCSYTDCSKDNHIDYEAIENSINQIKYDFSLTILGGEPFLAKDRVKKIIMKVSGNKFLKNISIVTNGTLYDRDFILFLKNNSVTIAISHDGHISNKRGNSNSILDLESNIRKIFKDYGEDVEKITIYMTIPIGNEKLLFENYMSISKSLPEIKRYRIFIDNGLIDVSDDRIVESYIKDYCAGLNLVKNEMYSDFLDMEINKANRIYGHMFNKYINNNAVATAKTCFNCNFEKFMILSNGDIKPCQRNFESGKEMYDRCEKCTSIEKLIASTIKNKKD